MDGSESPARANLPSATLQVKVKGKEKEKQNKTKTTGGRARVIMFLFFLSFPDGFLGSFSGDLCVLVWGEADTCVCIWRERPGLDLSSLLQLFFILFVEAGSFN